jgi:hypothetical protein
MVLKAICRYIYRSRVPFCNSRFSFVIPAFLLLFQLPFCHSRADGNLEKKSQQNTNTENFYFEKSGFPPLRE